jgi:hypothetical protein
MQLDMTAVCVNTEGTLPSLTTSFGTLDLRTCFRHSCFMDNSAAGFGLLIFVDICAMNIRAAGPAPLMSPNFTQVTPGTSQQVATYGPVLLGSGSSMRTFAARRTDGSTQLRDLA